jgi:hypothetical protein
MTALLSEIHAASPGAPVMVLFGGNPAMRHQVLSAIQALGGITAYGTLSEDEGMERLRTLPKVDLVLIGGRYTEEQRVRIRAYVREHLPGTALTEPGIEYPYEHGAVTQDIRRKLSR